VPWLEPDINDAMAELPGEGPRAAVIVPLGFVSDHMEVLWDLDTEAMETADEHGSRRSARRPRHHPAYVAGLVDLIVERLDGTAAADRPHETASALVRRVPSGLLREQAARLPAGARRGGTVTTRAMTAAPRGSARGRACSPRRSPATSPTRCGSPPDERWSSCRSRPTATS
jgi:hypothetical protein